MAKPQPKRSRGILTAKYTKDAKGRKTKRFHAESRRTRRGSRGDIQLCRDIRSICLSSPQSLVVSDKGIGIGRPEMGLGNLVAGFLQIGRAYGAERVLNGVPHFESNRLDTPSTARAAPAKSKRRLFRGFGFALVKNHGVSETCNMPMTLDQIVEETREMPAEVVAELIDRIMVARHGGMELPVVDSWKAETDRRIAEIESGKVKGVTPEENAARIKRILRR